jgi:hypothetical protein
MINCDRVTSELCVRSCIADTTTHVGNARASFALSNNTAAVSLRVYCSSI